MMAHGKAIRAARNLQQYCAERGCDPKQCAFRTESGICILQAARLPENYQLEGLREVGTCERLSDTIP